MHLQKLDLSKSSGQTPVVWNWNRVAFQNDAENPGNDWRKTSNVWCKPNTWNLKHVPTLFEQVNIQPQHPLQECLFRSNICLSLFGPTLVWLASIHSLPPNFWDTWVGTGWGGWQYHSIAMSFLVKTYNVAHLHPNPGTCFFKNDCLTKRLSPLETSTHIHTHTHTHTRCVID